MSGRVVVGVGVGGVVVALAVAGCFSGRPISGAYACTSVTSRCPLDYVCDTALMLCVSPSVVLDLGAGGGDGASGGGGSGGGGSGAVDVGGSCSVDGDCQTAYCDNQICELASGPPVWKSLIDMTFARQRPAVLLLADGTIMAAGGGYVGNDINQSVEVFVPSYVPNGNKWQDISGNVTAPYAPMVYSNQSAAAGLLGGVPYIAGGLHNEQTFEKYDVSGKMFTSVSAADGEFIDQAGSAVLANQLYVFGGFKAAGVVGGTAELYDPTTGWKTLGLLGTARRALAGAVGSDGIIYALGGHGDSGNDKTLDVIETYVATQWMPSTMKLPEPREDFGAALGPDGRLYIAGGLNGGATMPSAHALTITRKRWATVAALGVPRSALGLVTGADGLIYAIGGADPTGAPVKAAEFYGPAIGFSATSVSGSNFAAHANVTVYDGAVAAGSAIGSGVTDEKGILTAAIPLTLTSGMHTLYVMDDHSRFPVHVTVSAP